MWKVDRFIGVCVNRVRYLFLLHGSYISFGPNRTCTFHFDHSLQSFFVRFWSCRTIRLSCEWIIIIIIRILWMMNMIQEDSRDTWYNPIDFTTMQMMYLSPIDIETTIWLCHYFSWNILSLCCFDGRYCLYGATRMCVFFFFKSFRFMRSDGHKHCHWCTFYEINDES
jgi:hypothetical protein